MVKLTTMPDIKKRKKTFLYFQDSFRKYTTYAKFLSAISPEEWRKEKVNVFYDNF